MSFAERQIDAMEGVLGFDTSCYTTSIAAASRDGSILCSERIVLPVEDGKRGLRQNEAVFAHVRQLPIVMTRLEAVGREIRICAIAAASGPKDDEESYMPVFIVGLCFAQAMASAMRIPLYKFSHQQGHIAAGQIDNTLTDGAFIALHLSGGTTEMLLCDRDAPRLLGGTMDLHAGQLMDRVGVAMGLPFPAGPAMERLAAGCRVPSQALLPVSLTGGDLRCHLSGAEAKCLRWVQSGELSPEKIALEVFDFLARTITRLLAAGCRETRLRQALIVGGVASADLLRRLVAERMAKHRLGREVRVVFGKAKYSGDNGAGIARLGVYKHWGIS
ncbi:MAG: O-sialoglycoprotein endopeptidase [Clostridia bacterium]|nr:O-sialoglycoprotein endopeptidase [Clostridia bacterium]